MGFINPVVDSDDKDDDIFEPERSFSGVFNIFMNQWCVKKDKNAYKIALRFHAFPEIPEMLETHAHKKINFQLYREIKMSQIIVFWTIHEIKTPQNVVFRLNRESKMPRTSKMLKKPTKLI